MTRVIRTSNGRRFVVHWVSMEMQKEVVGKWMWNTW